MTPVVAARVALVTDSTAMLPPEVAAAAGIAVVPLQVVIGAEVHDEGSPEATPEVVAAALREWTPVSTSRPAPEAIAAVYERLAGAGAEAIVSVHLSGQMSGTLESARLAASRSRVPVTVVDTAQVGVATGYAALSGAAVAAAGGSAEAVAAAVRARAAACTSLLYVDTLEYLRRGGRIGAAAALFGGALAVKPLLRIDDGKVVPLERVRTTGRALARLEELAVEAVEGADGQSGQPGQSGQRVQRVEVTVAHLANAERAASLAERLAERLGARLAGEVAFGELGAVLGAHVGPGMIALCVAPVLDDADPSGD
ncbi:DegV family protein [Nocardioides sp. TRM66260-LWL]|uniref:DegV family protein n=1 Tax=Nocardioides sp. TRM66260-LWL TaxID=2874478 RepID=UPI001CC80C09|nr:DegV family protein [Nocardioides sp. TRM66260-LWL]MBZ5735882.1 DegV family protein [Nocardioides sp. TRM66260-LWL]